MQIEFDGDISRDNVARVELQHILHRRYVTSLPQIVIAFYQQRFAGSGAHRDTDRLTIDLSEVDPRIQQRKLRRRYRELGCSTDHFRALPPDIFLGLEVVDFCTDMRKKSRGIEGFDGPNPGFAAE